MGDIKLSIESESMRELIDDIISAIEEMGSVVVKHDGEIPEALEEILKSKGMFLYKPDEGIPDGMLKVLVEKEQEEVIDFLMDNEDSRARVVESLEEKGFEIQTPDSEEENAEDTNT